ncbi:MAG: 30S ribosomal protein S12 methylthiotransferase RimO [Gammaproteobacteria bacterium]|nr:30S ribosomal protein S12 methylthiotransferase RimO [Gammaproteobacteria bacterium]
MSPPKVGFISLGCPKALVDSERILTQLRVDGYEISPSYDDANIVVVNTCGFIDSAKEESLAAIGEAIDENGKVIVTGCLGIHEEDIRKAHPQVLSVTGPQQYEQVLGAVHEHAPFEREHEPFVDLVPEQGIKLTPRHYAYLKISEGCNHKCSFCIIPSMRGKLVSRSIDDVMREAEALVKAGVKELLIISQDTSAYGSDIKYRTGFWNGRPLKSDLQTLCEALGSLGVWVRLHYVYPYPHVDKIIPLMKEGNILPYLDIPFQHGSPMVLKRMRRPAAAENNLERIRAWREICPEITIRSTFIVGFPGETDEEFEELLKFLSDAQLDRVGCFQYSPVEGASANDIALPVNDELKQERWERFMQKQAAISQEKLLNKVGKTIEVLIDEIDGEDIIGRSFADAPEIDGNVFVQSNQKLSIGDLVKVKIDSAGEYDLWGEYIEN